MKIWLQEIAGPSSTYVHELKMLKIAKLAASPGTKISQGHVAFDYPIVTNKYAYGRYLSNQLVMEGVIGAEREGFDGTIINCWLDPVVRELREVVDVPVIGLAEPSMHLACILGDKFGALVPFDTQVPKMTENVILYGLKDKGIPRPVRGMSIKREEIPLMVTDPEKIKTKFMKVARECIKDGADVIIPACSLLSAMLINEGVNNVDGAPIVEPISAAVKMIETLVHLRKKPFNLNISRMRLYPSPRAEEMREIRKAFGLE